MVFIPIIYVCIKASSHNKKLREQGLEYSKLLNYEGGLNGKLPVLSNLEIYPNNIKLILGNESEEFEYSQIEKISVMTKSQMKNYISVGRAAMFGVLSLAMKKEKEVEKFFVVIELKDEQSIVLSTQFRNQCEKVYEYINKNLQSYKLSN